jgi:2-phospho-L-lactate guanylyltransferase
VRTAAILPVKRFSRAKQRLAADVAAETRLELARAMVADVLLALERTSRIQSTIVISSEPSLQAVSVGQGVILVEDEIESGQSAAVSRGVQLALAGGAERVLCVPGDCPCVDPAQLEELLAGEAEAVVVIPDRHGTGTNGLLLTPPAVIEPAFGEGSCARHLASARAAGVGARVERPSSLLLDVDTGADLDALRALLSGTSAPAAHTRAALGAGAVARGQPMQLAGSA